MEYVSKELALKYLMGNELIFNKVKDSFLESYHDCGNKVEKLISQHDFKNYELYVHSLKGISLNLGAEKLYNSAVANLESIRKGLWNEALIADFYKVLINTYRDLQSL